MVKHRIGCFIVASLMGSLASFTAAAATGSDPVDARTRNPHKIVVAGGAEQVTLEVDGEQLSIECDKDGHVTTTIVDMEQIGQLVGDAVGEAVAALQDMQVQVRLGENNRINIEGGDSEFELDLDQILAQLAAAVKTGVEGIDTSAWSSTGARDRRSDQDLRHELADLQKEMRALQKELRRLRANETPPDRRPPVEDR